MNTDQEAEQLARKIQERYRTAAGNSVIFDDLLPAHQQGWIDAAKLFLAEQDTAKDLLVQAVAAESKHRQEWQERAEKAEAKLSRSEASSARVLEDLRKVVEPPYRVKHGKPLTWEPGWVWEAMAFLVDALSEARLRKGTEPKPEGIEGTLVEAGTLERHVEEMDFSGLVIAVGKEALRDAKSLPLYRTVRVIEAA